VTEFKDRLKLALKGQSVNGAAKKVGISQGLMRKYLDGSFPSVERVVQLAQALRVSFLWLATGDGPMEGPKAADYLEKQIRELSPPPSDFMNNLAAPSPVLSSEVRLPIMRVVASAGHGSSVLKEEIKEQMTLSSALMRGLRLTAGETYLMYARGESMEPLIKGGELLICSTAERHLKGQDGVYVVRLEGDVLVKHVQRLPGNRVRIFSENRNYEPFEVALNDGIDFAILSKVLHVLRQV
jgi:phage repressor protein C with HTH and peptisase S24 domain